MRVVTDAVILSPTDLASFLTCRHRTGLDLAVARKALPRPTGTDPFAAILQRLGEEHQDRYVETLRARGLRVVNGEAESGVATYGVADPTGSALRTGGEAVRTDEEVTRTLAAMRAGADVIVQARLEGNQLAGYADILLRVDQPSNLGGWSYEVEDTKLARETKGGTILQLSAYSDLLERMQGRLPEQFHVVTPVAIHSYRVHDYAAYYRMVLGALRTALPLGHETLMAEHYPEPVDACSVCRWEWRCIDRRRKDDHLSFIAGADRQHRVELTAQGHTTLAAAAVMPVPVTFKPTRGAKQTYDRIGHQARVQHQQRTEGRPVFERLPVQPGEGVCRLPQPSSGDLFLDLEGARFAREGGREYLFGVWETEPEAGTEVSALRTMASAVSIETAALGHGSGAYRGYWAYDDAEERAAFEAVIDLIMRAWAKDPGMHVYHFNHYEPTAFKRLMGRYAIRAEALDQLLRSERFVDLFPIVRQAVRAGVESYSIKQLEQYYGYTRRVDLRSVSQPLMAVELALESQAPAAITADIRMAVQGYNEDDCRSTEALRNWLESQRDAWLAEGVDVPRPEEQSGDASADVSTLDRHVDALRSRLLDGLSADASNAAHLDHPRWLLAYLIDWHRREDKSQSWEYFRLKEMAEEELLDEGKAIAGLTFAQHVGPVLRKNSNKPTGSVIDRYSYPSQDVEVRPDNQLKLQDGGGFGRVVALDREARTIDIANLPARAALRPTAVFVSDVVKGTTMQKAVMALAEDVLSGRSSGLVAPGCGVALLYQRPPRLTAGVFEPVPGESVVDFAVRMATSLDRTTLAVQGPPGAGKTYAAARMIRALVAAGKRLGVTAVSHKVIRNLLDEIHGQAARAGERVRLAHKVRDPAEEPSPIRDVLSNDESLQVLQGGEVDVLGGTAWLWAREEMTGSVDVLFADEAGQISLANALAVSRAAQNLVLLGDPQQLEQPQKGSHPDGVDVSALDHVIGGARTMPAARGIFMPETYRLSPTLCAFTSEVFYEGKLQAKPGLAAQELRGTPFAGSRLWLVPVEHDGNLSASDEEVEAVAGLVERLLGPPSTVRQGHRWVDEHGVERPLTAADLRVVAPFNAQVNRLTERLITLGDIRVGTVDKFQGQTAAVVIYSMTTSRPEDAPRGMEFLYSLNRLNVATSRARCAVFLVASPRLFEPECRTPRQMQLANALCRYRELATAVELQQIV